MGLVPLDQMPVFKQTCSEAGHEGQPLDLWCMQCKKSLCLLCKQKGEHGPKGRFASHITFAIGGARHDDIVKDIDGLIENDGSFAFSRLSKQVGSIDGAIADVDANADTLLEAAVSAPFLFFAGEISDLCFTGSQKYF